MRIRARCPSCSRLMRSFAKVRKEAPVVLEILIAISILCALLIIDILWLGSAHRKEMSLILEEHSHDVGKFKKQFDSQIHQVNQLHEKEGHQLLEKHSDEVNRLKIQHHQEMERKIGSIQKELNNLLGISKEYWEKHEIEMAHNHENGNVAYDNNAQNKHSEN